MLTHIYDLAIYKYVSLLIFFRVMLCYVMSCHVMSCNTTTSLSQVSDFMLGMESAELNVTFFAAQTIHAKIQNNFRELPQER